MSLNIAKIALSQTKQIDTVQVIGAFFTLEPTENDPVEQVFIRYKLGEAQSDGTVSAERIEEVQITGQDMIDLMTELGSVSGIVSQFLIDKGLVQGQVVGD